MSDSAKRQLGIGGGPRVQVSLESKPSKKGTLVNKEDGTTLLVNDRNMSYKVSSEVITFWNMCDGSKNINQLAAALAAQLELTEDITPQIVDLVTRLAEAELLSA